MAQWLFSCTLKGALVSRSGRTALLLYISYPPHLHTRLFFHTQQLKNVCLSFLRRSEEKPGLKTGSAPPPAPPRGRASVRSRPPPGLASDCYWCYAATKQNDIFIYVSHDDSTLCQTWRGGASRPWPRPSWRSRPTRPPPTTRLPRGSHEAKKGGAPTSRLYLSKSSTRSPYLGSASPSLHSPLSLSPGLVVPP